ncbi:MAG: transglutaminase domain-containing protein [Atopobiaceae bacterium]|nr:transglutaminase domain-containing protein [Atopobiaceae bacterium]
MSLTVRPACRLDWQRDAFDSVVVTGYLPEPHDFFSYSVTGIAFVDSEHAKSDPAKPLYRFETPLTCAGPVVEALAQGRGVCQDYAHVMLAVCRRLGMDARYIAGMLDGEGATHAWVEVHDERGVWVGLDPTHDRAAGDSYIVIGHGRDYRDTKIDIGLFTGAGVSQTQWVNASVHEVGL